MATGGAEVLIGRRTRPIGFLQFFPAMLRQDSLSVAVGLLTAFENQVTGRLKCGASGEVRGHGAISRVGSVLAIDHGRHSLERGTHFI